MTVWAVKYRHGLIDAAWKDNLYQYITGIVQTRGNKLIRINGTADHVHLFFGMKPTESVSTLMQQVKEHTAKWINAQRLCRGRFEWQDGFGAFSYGHSQIHDVVQYIIHQEEHHRTKTFLEEYRQLLDVFEVAYDNRYLFREPV